MLPTLAEDLGADERTFRRAARRGAIRCRRPGPRQLELDPGELAYLRSHWPLLQRLTRMLRTERNVHLAVLYGSTARGDDRGDSDVDLLVAFRVRATGAATALARRIERTLERAVDVAEIAAIERDAPLLLLRALDEGRVLVDRLDTWPELVAGRGDVARASRRTERDELEAVERSWRMLMEDA